MRRERGGHVRAAAARALPRLLRGLALPPHAAQQDGQRELLAERARDLRGLVVAALAQAMGVQRHGHERVDRARLARGLGRDQ